MAATTLRSLTIAAAAAAVATFTSPTSATLTGPRCPSRFAWENIQLTSQSLAKQDAALFGFGNAHLDPPQPRCKSFPGDPSWPSDATWSRFNATLGGALIKTVPLAAPCYRHRPEYDPAACQRVREAWSTPRLHVDDPSSAMFPLYQGRTCMPTEDPDAGNCTLGGYATYSVRAENARQVQLAVNFARNANLRLVVKNTGHDFADKSVGAGALSVWTRGLNDVRFWRDYSCGGYRGPAFKLGSGVLTEDVYKAAEENGVTVVGGECRTVGIAGGFIAGGGHSPVSSLVGMGADQVLSMEVVLPDGRFVTVNETSYPDLFWALRGAGGGTYGVVTSITIRAYPRIPVTTMSFVYATNPNVTADTFFAGLGAYMKYFDKFTAAGAYGYFLVVGIGPGQYLFSMMPFWANNMTKAEVTALVTPYLDDLANLGIQVTPNITEYSSLFQAYQGSFGPETVGATDSHAASRLFPRENFRGARLNATLAAVRHAIEGGGILIGYNIRAAPNPNANQYNSVNPAWRKAAAFFILGAAWPAGASDAQIQQASKTLTTDWMEKWRAVTPGSGTYLSEADINEPDFQRSFYGEYYPRLYALKKKYDPKGVFYAPTGVGSEDWYVTNQKKWIPTQNGRLCRRR
ncbi:hypothetical protein VTJ83DRAFT_4684 [Remersonia thermophila]|uniref:FAD-binding PCMH-type domain-containing protein n=1 Tax=Remersonia thermophila TaxID=72144 RepID=A0ABR4DCU7_9PEZI